MNARTIGFRFREAVSLYFAWGGFDARPRKEKTKISESILEDQEFSHIVGIDDFAIVCSASTAYNSLSGSLSRAQEAAGNENASHAVVVQARKGKSVAESFAIMGFADFVRLIEKKNS